MRSPTSARRWSADQAAYPRVTKPSKRQWIQFGQTEPLMTLTETVQYAALVADAIDIPLIVDANAGFGDLLHTRRTVALFTRTGVAGVHIEDQYVPKQARYFEGHKWVCLLYTSPSPRDGLLSRMPSSA